MEAVSIKEAADRLGISQDTVRRRIRNGALTGEQHTTPQGFKWTVELPEVSNGLGDRQADQAAQDQVDGAELAIAVEELRARVQSLEAQLGVKDTQIGELHRLMATTALNAAPARPWWRFW